MRKAGLFLVFCVVLSIFVLRTSGFHSKQELLADEFLENYEVVNPMRIVEGRHRRSVDTLSTVYQNGHREDISFSVEGFGRRFILQLSRNRLLLPKGSRHSFYSSKGILTSQPFKSIDNCYYQGTVKGLPKSSVAVSTCEGIEGIIYDGKERFYIQPSDEIGNKTHSNPHIMFRMSDLKLPKVLCGQEDNHDIMKLLHRKKNTRTRRSINSETKYIELIIVNDNSQFNYYKENTTKRALKIANIVDSLYRPLHVRVPLIGMITWKDKDEIDVVKESSQTLSNFVKWRNEDLIKKRNVSHDNIQLLTQERFEGQTVGKANVLAICTTRSAGVVRDHSSNAAATASTLAHEMGHNLGLGHDNKDECDCGAKKKNQACIMSGVARYEPATDWSSCSLKEFDAMLEKGLDSCLFNQPKELFGDPVCGNGFKEKGEECDCGNYTECEKYTDNCCDPKTCKLRPHADCDEGPCCKECKFKSTETECREKVTECDLPEFCDGRSSACPPNKYVYNGRPCDGGKGYCYGGICPTHDSQCRVLWGNTVKSGPELCYTVNMRGTYHGSCKAEDGVFTKCKYKDIYCGMLHCTNTKTDLPIIGTERNAYKYTYKTKDGSVECRSTSLDLGNDVPDPGMTKEGTKCGDKKLCLDNKCVNITQLYMTNPQCPGDCSSHGVCNNEGECFCDECWGGSDCSEKVECKGVGQSKLAGYVILVFLCIGLVVGCVGGFIYRDQLKAKWKERQQNKQKRYRTVDDKPTLSPSGKRASEPLTDGREMPTVTMAPKPPPPPPSKPAASRQPGKIDLPSWPTENSYDGITVVPRRAPPGVPKQSSLNRASSPPMGSDGYKPTAGPRPDSYAGVLDRPVNKPPPRPSPLAGLSQTSSGRPLLPSEIKKSQESIGDKTGPVVPGRPELPHKPARKPPPPPSKPPVTGYSDSN